MRPGRSILLFALLLSIAAGCALRRPPPPPPPATQTWPAVHVENDTRQIQLRRAAMTRLIERDPLAPARIEPRTSLLRAGLDRDEPQGYDIHEEEVPRAGIRVHQSFRRARWYDGHVFTWLGIGKQVGRGERSSGLSFDQIPPKER
jgi:hypothetical protein